MFRVQLFQGRDIGNREKEMTKAAANSAKFTDENEANGACVRFEPVQQILTRCDLKTIEHAPILGKLAA